MYKLFWLFWVNLLLELVFWTYNYCPNSSTCLHAVLVFGLLWVALLDELLLPSVDDVLLGGVLNCDDCCLLNLSHYKWLVLWSVDIKGCCVVEGLLVCARWMLKSGSSEVLCRDWSWSVAASVSKEKQHALASTGSLLVGWLYCAEVIPHIR